MLYKVRANFPNTRCCLQLLLLQNMDNFLCNLVILCCMFPVVLQKSKCFFTFCSSVMVWLCDVSYLVGALVSIDV